MRDDLPAGTVTFLFTDVEGSTRLLGALGEERYAAALAEHRRLIREACARSGGVEVDTQGDAFFVAFPTAPGALAAADAIARSLAGGPVRVRAGLHTGTPHVGAEGYVGHDVHRAARIAAAGHGGQILVSTTTAALVSGDGLRDLGEHRFKDLAAAERVYQLGDAEFGPLNSLYRTNLPVPATPFLGREAELAETLRLLASDHVRLLTLTGPGGTGKTRLALQVAAEASDRYPDGTWWVPLAPLRDAAAVPSQIAHALGTTGDPATYVSDKRLLLVLDNLEHVLAAAAGIAALLRDCPRLEIVATSRELLRIEAEHAYAVPTLSDEDGTQLFRSRARAVAGDVETDAGVQELCRRLDNLPLAIELAAARTRHLTVAQLHERLAQRLDLLRAGRDADPRQQTLRTTIEWSHELLEEAERELFARLSVFAGGSTLEAIEAVCDGDLETVSALVDKSLLRKSADRFWMLETIRAFAAQRLHDTGEEDTLRRRHAEFVLQRASQLGFTVETIDAGAIQLHDVAIAELGNIRAAIDWALGADPELGLRIAVALENFWISYEPFGASSLFDELTERAHDVAPELHALATRCRANLAVMTGDDELGIRRYEEVLGLYEAIGDGRGAAISLFRLGANLYWRAGERERGRRCLEDAVARSRELGFRINELQATGLLGAVEVEEGNVERGLAIMADAAEHAREAGFKWWQANTLSSLATYEHRLGRTDDAEVHGRAALVLAREMGDRRHAVQALGLLVRLAHDRGDRERAGLLWGALEAEELRGPVGVRPRMRPWDQQRREFAAVVLEDADEVFERGRAGGRVLALADAVRVAVGGLP